MDTSDSSGPTSSSAAVSSATAPSKGKLQLDRKISFDSRAEVIEVPKEEKEALEDLTEESEDEESEATTTSASASSDEEEEEEDKDKKKKEEDGNNMAKLFGQNM